MPKGISGMLYKKNKAKALSDELFKNPGSEYRGTPFWSWNCKMTPEILEKQIEYLKEMGFGGFHMHSRAGMDNPYLSEEFMGLVRACVDKAKREDMLAWLYDEDRWPSGAAGGLVTKDPEYRARVLYFVPACRVRLSGSYPSELENGARALCDFPDELSQPEAVKQGKPYFIAAYDISLDENGCLASCEVIDRKAEAKGTKWYAFCATTGMSDWYNGYCYVDTLSGKAIKRFIEVTHETYKKYVGDEFDRAVPAIFTDEPQYARDKNLNFPTDLDFCCFAWTPDLPKSYKKSYGDDIIPHIPELVWELPGGEVSVSRYRFRDHLCQRFTDAFSALCGKWCDKNGIKLTGHMMEEPTLQSQTAMIGETMRAYKYFGFPGIDMLCNRVELTTAKQTQSVVHQYGKEAMTSELYGVTNWDFDFRGHKFQGDWQAALGVTIRVPHLSWVSMKGDAKRDYPASISYQSPWYKEYSYIEDHFARLNTALTRGKPHVSIGVIHPIESYWLHWGIGRSTASVRNQMESRFDNFIKWMLFGQLDFDYISESLFPDECPEASYPLKAGKMSYTTLIVPGAETLRRTTFERLKDFHAAGGRLIFLGECPRYIDAVPSSDVKELYENSVHIPFERLALLEALDGERELEIRRENGDLTDNYIYQMRDDGTSRWLFISNAVGYSLADVVRPRKLLIKIKGEFAPKLYDTLSGEIKEISYRCENGYTHITYNAYLHDSILLRLTKSKAKSLNVPRKEYRTVSSVNYKDKVRYEREEPNVLVLDMAEYLIDDETEFRPLEEIRRLDAKVRKAAGIPPKSGRQPWTLPEEKTEHTVTLRFTFASETRVKGAKLAMEDAEVSVITFDGKNVPAAPDGYFTDEAIKTVPLPEIKTGKHTITVTIPLGSRTYTEWYYLLGEFNVRVEGCEKTLTAPTDTIGFGSVVPQGLPFYGGNIRYTCNVEVGEDGCALRIHANRYRGALISVKVDGNPAGKIVFAPYDIIVENVGKGTHTVEFTLYGNRFNCFAALHNSETDLSWVGPGMYFTTGDSFSYEYNLRDMGILASPVIDVIK